MTSEGAKTAVSISAMTVAGIYIYRRLSSEVGSSAKAPPSAAHFLIGFGFVYITLAVLAAAAPPLGGMLAVLVATGDTLVNGEAILQDVNKGLGAVNTPTVAVPNPTGTTTAGAVLNTGNIANAAGNEGG